MSMPKIILIGAGGHANACIDVIEQGEQFQIAGLVGMPGELNTRCMGYSVIAVDTDLPQLAQEYQYVLVALGQIESPDRRHRMFANAKALGFGLPVVVSPRSYVSRHATVGEGTIVMHYAMINACANVGRNCIINSKALVEHDVVVEDNCHISTGAIVNGGAVIKKGSFVGSNAATKEGVQTVENAFIRAGTLFKGANE